MYSRLPGSTNRLRLAGELLQEPADLAVVAQVVSGERRFHPDPYGMHLLGHGAEEIFVRNVVPDSQGEVRGEGLAAGHGRRALVHARMSKATSNVILTTNYIKMQLGLPLSTADVELERVLNQ